MARSYSISGSLSGISRIIVLALLAGTLAACENFDVDLRDGVGGFDTSSATQTTTAPRPEPDSRGVISYPGYQVAVAQSGDTVATVARRVGVDGPELARFNGISLDAQLRAGEILALQTRVAADGADGVDITTLAENAIESAPEDAARTVQDVETEALAEGPEPIRHKVERGETAFTIARLYNVPVRSLAEWNALDSDFTIREGQFLLIPIVSGSSAAAVTAPGAGSATPTPPSASTPVPAEDATPGDQAAQVLPAPDIGAQTAPPDDAEFLVPVTGSVIRTYSKGRNEGIDFSAAAGAEVRAADAGTVAAITRDTNDVAIIVVRHDGDLLTVYTQVDSLQVDKGDRVSRGQTIARVKAGDPSFLHFEVRNGLESVDPAAYLNL